MRILRARLLAAAQEEADREASDARRSQVRTVDRSERVRTYNFPENRITDHRVNFKAYNLDRCSTVISTPWCRPSSTPTRQPSRRREPVTIRPLRRRRRREALRG